MREEGVKKILVFSDLDGALLSLRTYSFEGAEEALRALRERGVPLILSSSKTRREMELWRERLGVSAPFISENGGGIFVPTASDLKVPKGFSRGDHYWIRALGVPYGRIREAVEALKGKGFSLRGFGDMETLEVAELTGMSLEEARLAKTREFSEPCLFSGDEGSLREELASQGLTLWRGGRFVHIQGPHDKGQAMATLTELYEASWGEVRTIALGDSPNDLPMLQRADFPVVIRRKGGLSDQPPPLPNLLVTEEEGPRGWGKAMITLLEALDG
ncbi:MAG: mannosyl-3-phosphoglycerate phosphatase [Deltaproteobacteria bacterium]|nr:MAG: mannosyl-3-phosphoglycerate phosphatase [Deltaproteobacteria bacterium]